MSSSTRLIKFKTLDNKITDMSVDPTIKILELKKLIMTKFNAPIEGQRLIFKGKLMKDNQKLDDFIKEDNEIIHLLFKTKEEIEKSKESSTQPNQNESSSTRQQQSSSSNSYMNILNGLLNGLSQNLSNNNSGNNTNNNRSFNFQDLLNNNISGVNVIVSPGLGIENVSFNNANTNINNTSTTNTGLNTNNNLNNNVNTNINTNTNINASLNNSNHPNISLNTGNNSSNPQAQPLNSNPIINNNNIIIASSTSDTIPNEAVSMKKMNENNRFPIQTSDTDRKYENMLKEINNNISNINTSLSQNFNSINLPLLNTAQNILTAISRSLRQYIYSSQLTLPYLMRLCELLEREQLITSTEERNKCNELINKCMNDLESISKSAGGISRILRSTSFGLAPNTGFVSVISSEIIASPSINMLSSIDLGSGNVNMQNVQEQISASISNLNNMNRTTGTNTNTNISTNNNANNVPQTNQVNQSNQTNQVSTSSQAPQNNQVNVQSEQPKKEEIKKESENKTKEVNANVSGNRQGTSQNRNNSNSNSNNLFGNIMNTILQPNNLNNIMSTVGNLFGGNSNSSGSNNQNNNQNSFGNLISNLVSQIEGSSDEDDSEDRDRNRRSTSNQPQKKEENQPKLDTSPKSSPKDFPANPPNTPEPNQEIKFTQKVEIPTTENIQLPPSNANSNISSSNSNSPIDTLKKILDNPILQKKTYLNTLSPSLKLSPHVEFEPFTNCIIKDNLSIFDIINLKKLSIRFIMNKRKELRALVKDKDIKSVCTKLTDLMMERIIFMETELDKLSQNKSFDIEPFFNKYFNDILLIIIDEKMNDYDWEDELRKLIIKMILEFYNNLCDIYQTGKEGALFSLEYNVESILIDLIGKKYVEFIREFDSDLMTNYIENLINLCQNYKLKEEITNSNNDNLLSIDEIFKIAKRDQELLEKEKKENENKPEEDSQRKFGELYYRTSLFQN